MKITLPRGTKDILPDEMVFWHHIESMSRAVFELYNFDEIRTPLFEMTDLFVRGIGNATDIVEKEMYTFTDKGNRSLTLRPEGTAPIARAYLSNGLQNINPEQKLYYIGPMFRYERPQAGRYRQFHQVGIEHIGRDNAYTDAQLIAMGIHLFDALGIGSLSVQVNSVGCPICRPVIENRLKQFLGSSLKSLCDDCNRRYDSQPLRILDCKKPNCKHYFAGMPDIKESFCQECKDHFNTVLNHLDTLQISFSINPLLVRGLDYYTKTTFEIVSDQLGAQNALCGGGRYDKLIEQLGGKSTPAVGLAFGMERAVMVLKELSEIKKHKKGLVYVAPLGTEQQDKCIKLVDDIRKNGIRCETDLTKYELKHHLKKANKADADFVLIYGENESDNKTILLKDMEKGTQEEIPIKKVIKVLSDEKHLQNPLFN